MKSIVKNGKIWDGSGFRTGSLLIAGGRIAARSERPEGEPDWDAADARVIDAGGCHVLPGLVDVHVHLREPGFSYKETIYDGTRAAAHGGFTTVCPMPNLKPAPDTPEHLREQLDIIDRDAAIEVLPYATITRSRLGHELVDYAALAPEVVGFSDDGSGVQSAEVMLEAMKGIAKTGKVLAAHCEVNDLLRGGYIHEGDYAREHGHRGICSESEWAEVARDIDLARESGCRLHICHVSSKESVELVRRAKAEGLPVTCETGAHYLAFNDSDLREEGRFKMNPPLRGRDDQQALLQGIADGTIDCIASDHAPHSAEEKSKGLEKSAMGVTGIELSLPAAYTYAVRTGAITLERLVALMADNPRRIFDIKGGLNPGDRADVTVVDFNGKFTVDPADFLSKGKATPFEGLELYGKVKATIAAGVPVYQ